MNIPFFKSTLTGSEAPYIQEVLGDSNSFFRKQYIAKCEAWFKEGHGLDNFYLTKSCTSALELSGLALGIKPGDEVIMPSYAFVSCGNAFAMLGAKCKYVDVYADSMNIDDTKLEQAITDRTKAIVTINYAGVACNYTAIRAIADKHQLYIIEDNAHGAGAKQGDKSLGSFGDVACFSFDHLKNITCGQGGGIVINNPALLDTFFVHYEFGTNRRSFFNGKADRYEWKGLGGNHPLSELNAAMLYAQLLDSEKINAEFVRLWQLYKTGLSELEKQGKIVLPSPKAVDKHNAHCFFIKTDSADERIALIKNLHYKGINAQFHYTPLHSSEYGKAAGEFRGADEVTTTESRKLLRLPLYYGLNDEEVTYVLQSIHEFYKG